MPIRDRNTKKEKLIEQIVEHNSLDYKIKSLTKKIAPVKAKLKKITDEKGYETPNGSKRYEVGEYELVNTLRSSTVLVPEAVMLIEKHLPQLASKLIHKVPVVREEKLQQMIADGIINTRMAKRLYTINESFAFTVKDKVDEK
jgi:hypothetical protein